MSNNINARCVVTGLGMVNAIGKNVEECWTNALKGTPGIDKVKSVNSDNCYAHLGAEVSANHKAAYALSIRDNSRQAGSADNA